jgi:hypothetical protein
MFNALQQYIGVVVCGRRSLHDEHVLVATNGPLKGAYYHAPPRFPAMSDVVYVVDGRKVRIARQADIFPSFWRPYLSGEAGFAAHWVSVEEAIEQRCDASPWINMSSGGFLSLPTNVNQSPYRHASKLKLTAL